MGAVVKRQLAIAAQLIRENPRDFLLTTAAMFAALPAATGFLLVAQAFHERINP